MLSPAGLRGRAGHIAAGLQCDRRAAAGNRTRAWPTGGGIRKCFWEGQTPGELRGLRGDVGGGGGGSRGGSSLRARGAAGPAYGLACSVCTWCQQETYKGLCRIKGNAPSFFFFA